MHKYIFVYEAYGFNSELLFKGNVAMEFDFKYSDLDGALNLILDKANKDASSKSSYRFRNIVITDIMKI
ncbi:hypothetical protein [Proteus columbae]|uniref:hypothetical protein n=1 Tax=Proteus columbae TaxID=1987580 RepID=UPI00288C2115|nr:hypothetical protein [Proteus columbae]